MSNTENSALIALGELKNLEAARVADIESERRAREEAERRVREEAERKAREEAERRAKAEAERIARETAEREAREREERLRLQEAELRAKAEQEARLKEEQMRLDAQVKLAEKKARPIWLYGILAALVIGIGVGGYFIYQWKQDSERKAAELAAQREAEKKEQDAAMAALLAEFKGLQEEQARMAKEKEDIENKLQNVTDATERQRLLAEKEKLDRELEANEEKQKKNKGKTSTAKTGGSGEPKPEKSKGGITVNKNVDDPLDGL